MEALDGRRRLTLLDQMMMSAATTSAATTDNGGRALTGLTLEDILMLSSASPKQPPPPETSASVSGRTLLDIIRAEEPNKAYTASLIGKKEANKKAWEALKDRLRLKKASATLLHRRRHVTPDPMPENPTADHPSRRSSGGNSPEGGGGEIPRRRLESLLSEESLVFSREAVAPEPMPENPTADHPSRRNSGGNSPEGGGEIPRRRLESLLSEESLVFSREAVVAAEEGSVELSGLGEPEPARMSLMELLGETDRQIVVEGGSYTMDDCEEEESEAVAVAALEGGGGGGGVEQSYCCVCMVRHKGSAFIPCGHTFCRKCSRELWVQRGNCPLCNNSILEILDIF